MEKLIMFMVILASTLSLWVKDVEIYLMDRAYRTVQYSLEHAVHDAALQIDPYALSEGDILFLEDKAKEALYSTLQKNLPVDQFLNPLSSTLLEKPLKIIKRVYIDDDFRDPQTGSIVTFPHRFEYELPDGQVFHRVVFGPSIALIVEVQVKGQDDYQTFLVIQEHKL